MWGNVVCHGPGVHALSWTTSLEQERGHSQRPRDSPKCLGAIKGKHVAIQAPSASTGSRYYDYKGSVSIILAVVDACYPFWMMNVGHTGKAAMVVPSVPLTLARPSTRGASTCQRMCPLPGAEDLQSVTHIFMGGEAFPLRRDFLKVSWRKNTLTGRSVCSITIFPVPGRWKRTLPQRVFGFSPKVADAVVEVLQNFLCWEEADDEEEGRCARPAIRAATCHTTTPLRRHWKLDRGAPPTSPSVPSTSGPPPSGLWNKDSLKIQNLRKWAYFLFPVAAFFPFLSGPGDKEKTILMDTVPYCRKRHKLPLSRCEQDCLPTSNSKIAFCREVFDHDIVSLWVFFFQWWWCCTNHTSGQVLVSVITWAHFFFP